MTLSGWAIALVALILVAWILRSVYVVFFLRKPWSVPPNDDAACASGPREGNLRPLINAPGRKQGDPQSLLCRSVAV